MPEGTAAVVYRGETATGMRSTQMDDAALMAYGEQGASTGRVRIDASAMTEPGRGDTILVDGQECFVMATRTDAAGALLVIDYSEQRPIEGV